MSQKVGTETSKNLVQFPNQACFVQFLAVYVSMYPFLTIE